MGCINNSKNKITKTHFDEVFANRKKLKSQSFNLYWCTSRDDCSRLGVSVAKKNISKAVVRNKYKRLVKENFRVNSKSLPAVNLVVVIKKDALSKPYQSFSEELNTAWDLLLKRVAYYLESIS